jgi:hypothetical protein
VIVPHALSAQNSAAHTSVPASQAPAVHTSSPLHAFPSEHWAAVWQATASNTGSCQACTQSCKLDTSMQRQTELQVKHWASV